jgi:uncharacterized membrane protein YesL
MVTLSLLGWAFILVATILLIGLVGLRERIEEGGLTPAERLTPTTIKLIVIILVLIIPKIISYTTLTMKNYVCHK